MSLRATIQKAVITAFKAAGDVVRPATYKVATGAVTRDLVAGTSTAVVVNHTLPRTIFSKFEDKEITATIVAQTDEKLIFPAFDLNVVPKIGDTVLDENGRTWQIIQRLSDPASALVKLQVRSSR